MKKHKVLFGYFEMIFDLLYLCVAAAAGVYMLLTALAPAQRLAGVAALVLAVGDAFHLLPRVAVIGSQNPQKYQRALGFGKMVTSLTMAFFYLLLWQVGLLLSPMPVYTGYTYAIWFLVVARVVLCVLPQNRWLQGPPLYNWGIWRNVPFVLQGAMVLLLFAKVGGVVMPLRWMWLAIALSFLFYLPVVLWADKNPKLGMLMLPKTCAYIWILLMLTNI
ncbi:hypothetical protein LJC61_01855 [Ruminococcaceae bacterium OttesenSCG-928-A16]|nr:hypothetical protein [Ruminococcaceae bacterium OttesenSCG-928-A16]